MILLFSGITLAALLILVYLPFRYRYRRRQWLAWQQWAYPQVSDVQELKRNARLAGLDFDDGWLAPLFLRH